MTTVTVSETTQTVTVEESGTTVEVASESVSVVSVGTQGPAGPAGPQGPSGVQTATGTAGETLSALRLVYADPATGKVHYADKDDATHAARVVGLTLNAAALDADVSIQTLGPIEDDAWVWDTGADPTLFLGDDGALVQGSPPAGAFVLAVGFVTAATKIFIRIGVPILN